MPMTAQMLVARGKGFSRPTKPWPRSPSASSVLESSRPREPPHLPRDVLHHARHFRVHERRHPAGRDDPPDSGDREPWSMCWRDRESSPASRSTTGAKPLAGCPAESITEGLDGLRQRLAGYHESARASPSGEPSSPSATGCRPTCASRRMRTHSRAMPRLSRSRGRADRRARGADGRRPHHRALRRGHRGVLHAVFDALYDQHVSLEGMLLKPNMVIAGQRLPARGLGRGRRDRHGAHLRRHVRGRTQDRLLRGPGPPRGHHAPGHPSISSTGRNRGPLSFPTAARCRTRRSRLGAARSENRTPRRRLLPSRQVRERRRRWAGIAVEMESRGFASRSCADARPAVNSSGEAPWHTRPRQGSNKRAQQRRTGRTRADRYRRRARGDARLLARLQLPLGGDDLSEGQPAPSRAAEPSTSSTGCSVTGARARRCPSCGCT